MATIVRATSTFPMPTQDGSSYDDAQKREYRRVRREWWRRALGAIRRAHPDLQATVDFNPGGDAVWGEHWIRITRKGIPVLEAFESDMLGVCVRQWDGKRSGRNQWVMTIADLVATASRSLDAPFQPF